MLKIKIIFSTILSLSFFLLLAENAQALTPVARFDVVPYQRIEYGNSFNVGVVAFSKPGIEKVEFAATGQGYSGGTKTATSMTLNTRTDTWEYWVAFPASDFNANGAITITATVTDNDANIRELTLPMIVEGASAFTPSTCWANSVSGNNTTCTAGNNAAPCQTIAGCISKLSDADGGIIYLEEGTYSANTSATTTTEWLTITKSATANRDNVIIDTGQLTTGFLKYDSVTLQSRGTNLYVADDSSTRLWTNNTRRIGSGRWVLNSNPVHHSDPNNHWSTNDYTYNADYAYRRAALVRWADISTIGNDAFANTEVVINCTADDLDNGTTGWHSDAYQVHTTGVPPASNRIVYNYKATNLHTQGIFMRSDDGTATDNAFVNVFMEMREPPNVNESGIIAYAPWSIYHSWDHLLMWNCSSPTATSMVAAGATNSSFIGNVHRQIFDYSTDVGDPVVTSAAPGNAGNNEYLHNHYMYIRGLTENCAHTTKESLAEWPCPQWYAKAPDSSSPTTYTSGGGVIDVDYTSATFTYPTTGSVLQDRFTAVVPVDIYNRERGSISDVGAVEYSAESIIVPDETCSDGIQNQNETGVDCGGLCSACAVPTYQCNDGIDNDSDGLTDYPDDPGCSSATDDDETNVVSDSTPPSRSAGAPSGELSSGTASTTISLSTNESATCKYSTSSGTAYASMTNTFSGGGSTSHTSTVSGLSDGSSYNYYARCVDAASNANADDYQIAFFVESPVVVEDIGDENGGSNNDDGIVSNENNVSNNVVVASKSDDKDKKKEKVKKRTITVSKKKISRGQVLVERGKQFSKNSTVTLYFSKYEGGYYPPMRVRTNKSGKFAVFYKIPPNKPSGTYSWYAVDDKTGKKSKTIKFKVR